MAQIKGKLPFFVKDNAKFTGLLNNTVKTNKEHIKELRVWAKENLKQPIFHDGLDKEIRFTSTGIKEYLNQPHKFFIEKNESILNVKQMIKKSTYIYDAPDAKGNHNNHYYLFENKNKRRRFFSCDKAHQTQR